LSLNLLSLSLLLSWHENHAVLPHHSQEAMEPNNHGLKPGTKINLSS
jgi:hypothetical protein